MAKVLNSSSGGFAKGGPASGMVGRTGATIAGPGTTAKVGKGQGGKFAKGGPASGMVGRTTVGTKRPGTTGPK